MKVKELQKILEGYKEVITYCYEQVESLRKVVNGQSEEIEELSKRVILAEGKTLGIQHTYKARSRPKNVVSESSYGDPTSNVLAETMSVFRRHKAAGTLDGPVQVPVSPDRHKAPPKSPPKISSGGVESSNPVPGGGNFSEGYRFK